MKDLRRALVAAAGACPGRVFAIPGARRDLRISRAERSREDYRHSSGHGFHARNRRAWAHAGRAFWTRRLASPRRLPAGACGALSPARPGASALLRGVERMSDPQLPNRCRELLLQVDLEAESDRNVGKLSRGMQQRIALAQALINDPELLILDEPTSALDPLSRVAVRELLREAHRKGKTIFLSSHLLSEVEAICHRVAIVKSGRLVEIARMSDLLAARDRLEIVARGISAEAFAGSPSKDGLVTINIAAPALREVLERIWAAGGEVLSVNPARRSLEDVFVDLIQDRGRELRPVVLLAANFVRESRWDAVAAGVVRRELRTVWRLRRGADCA